MAFIFVLNFSKFWEICNTGIGDPDAEIGSRQLQILMQTTLLFHVV